MRHIHANDFCKCLVFQKLAQKPALATSEVENTLRAIVSKGSHDGSDALLGQADWFLNSFFFARMSFRYFVRCGLFIANEATQCFTREPLLMFQISICDQLAFGVLAKPPLAVAQQLFHFCVADPIMLVVIEHR